MKKTHSLLLIEDGPLFAETLSEFLANERYEVQSAATFDEALDIAKARRFDVMLADIVVPGTMDLDGFLLCLRTQSPNKRTPVVLMTAWPHLAGERSDIVLVKPFYLSDLLSTLKRVISEEAKETGSHRSNSHFQGLQPQGT